MLILEIEFLTGRYVASAWSNRAEPEWPPHPARVFSAMVAACHEAGGSDVERRALEWLQELPAPGIAASLADERPAVPIFVPVNDTSFTNTAKKELEVVAAERALEAAQRERRTDVAKLVKALSKKRASLQKQCNKSLSVPSSPGAATIERATAAIPLYRPRRGRRFPSVTPHDARVQLIWRDAVPDKAIEDALRKLVSRVSSLGHSSSLVRCALGSSARKPTWIPDDSGAEVLRVPGPNQLEELEAAFAFHRGQKPRVLPYRSQRYRHVAGGEEPQAVANSGCFGEDWIVFQRVDGPALPIERTVDVAVALRNAVIQFFLDLANGSPDTEEKRRLRENLSELGWNRDRPVPESVSGLAPERRPLQRPHLAFVALPFIDHAYADGRLMGAAVILPRSMDATERKIALVGLGHVRELKLCTGSVWTVRRLTPALTRPLSLQPEQWCRERSMWSTATPILLDRFPGNLASRDSKAASRAEEEAKETIRGACERIGLPRPRSVELVALPPFRGVSPATCFRQPARTQLRPRRVAVHAILDFAVPVRGPILLGAGRYLGLGLCRPVTGRAS